MSVFKAVDRFYVLMFGRWMNRVASKFGWPGAISLILKIANDIIKTHADRVAVHPDVIAKEALDLADADLFTVKGGGA